MKKPAEDSPEWSKKLHAWLFPQCLKCKKDTVDTQHHCSDRGCPWCKTCAPPPIKTK